MRNVLVIPMLLTLLMLVACSQQELVNDNPEVGEMRSYVHNDFDVTTIRTDMFDLTDNHRLIVIKTYADLLEKISTVDDTYNETLYTYLSTFDEDYFDSQMLAVLVFVEGSGSHRLEVTDIDVDASLAMINITRNIPEIGTTDMAAWHIIITLPQLDEIDYVVNVAK